MVMNSQVLGVLLNFAIVFIFSSIGINIFTFMRFRNDWYKITACEDNEYESEKEKTVNNLTPYT